MRSNVTKLFEIWRAEQLDDFDVILPALKQEEQLLDTMQLLYHRWIEAVPDMAHITHSSFDGERRAWGAWDDQYCAWKDALNGLLISGIPLPYAGMSDIPDVTSGTFLEENIQPAFEHAKQALHSELDAFRIWTNMHRQWAKQSCQILKLRLDCLGKTNVQTKDAETIFLNLQKEQEGLAERSAAAREAFVNWRKAHGTWRTLWAQWLYLFTTEKYRQAEKTYFNSLEEELYWRDESDDANQLYKKYVVGENQTKNEQVAPDDPKDSSGLPAAAVEKKDSAPVCIDDETFGGADEEPADEENWMDEAFDDDEEEDNEMTGDWDADEEEPVKSSSNCFVTKDRIIRSAQTAIDLIHRAHFGNPGKMPVTDLEALNVLSDLLTTGTTGALKEHFPKEAADVELLVLRILADAAERATRMPRRIFSRREIRVLKSLLRTLFPIQF